MAEAMASSKPVVATRFAGAVDLIRDGETGFVVGQEDYKSFAERIPWLLDNPDKAREMGAKAKAFIQECFAGSTNIDVVIRLWRKTAGIS